MGWLDSVNRKKEEEKLPERLKGKTPEQVAAELEELDKAKKELEEAKAARSAEAEGFTKIKTELDEVRARLAAAEASRQPPKQQIPEEFANFVEEPDKAFGQRVAPVANIAIQNSALTARILAQQSLDNQDMASQGKSMDGRLFRAWQSDIDAESKKYAPLQLANVDAWLGIFYYIKGHRADELSNPETRKTKYGFLEPARSGAPPPKDEGKKTDELTDAEKHVADKMGVSYENYSKRKKAMQFVNT